MMESAQNNKSAYLLYLVFGLVLLLTLAVGITYAVKSGKLNLPSFKFAKTDKVSPYVLWLTSPVTTFSGKIDKISGNKVWVSQTFSQQQPLPVPPTFSSGETPKDIPVPVAKTITFQVVVNDKTLITHIPPSVPYLLKTNTVAQPAKLELADLKAGQMIAITSSTDLRTINNEFEAAAIQVNAGSNAISGRIDKIEDNKIYVKAIPPTAQITPIISTSTGQSLPVPQEKEYVIAVTSDTEISRTPPMAQPGASPESPQRLSLSDLKPDMQVVVYTDADTGLEFSFTALRIEPLATTPPVPPTSSSQDAAPPPAP